MTGRYRTFESKLRRSILIHTIERALLESSFGALVGAVTGASAALPGIATGATVGALVGLLAAIVGEQEDRRRALRDRRLET